MAFSVIASVLGPALSTAADSYLEATDELSDTNVKRRKAFADKQVLPLQTAVETQSLQRQLKSPHGKIVHQAHDAAGNWITTYEDNYVERTNYGGGTAAGGSKETAYIRKMREIVNMTKSDDPTMRALGEAEVKRFIHSGDTKTLQAWQQHFDRLDKGLPPDPALTEYLKGQVRREMYVPGESGRGPVLPEIPLPGAATPPLPATTTAPPAPQTPPTTPGVTSPTVQTPAATRAVPTPTPGGADPTREQRIAQYREDFAKLSPEEAKAKLDAQLAKIPGYGRGGPVSPLTEDLIQGFVTAHPQAGNLQNPPGAGPKVGSGPPTAATTSEQAARWRANQPGQQRAGQDFDAEFNTQLTPQEEQAFQQWKAQYAPRDSGADYDLRGAFKAGLKPDPQTGHWPDTFKKPNHPTFSDQSRYAPYGTPGRWQGQQFVPPTAQAPPTQRMPAPTVPGTLPPLAPGATRGYQRKEAGLAGQSREQQIAATALYNQGKLPSAQLIGGEIDVGALPPAERELVNTHVAEAKNQAGLGRTLQRARPYLGQIATLEESEELIKKIEPLITEENVGPRGWATSFLQDMAQQMPFLDAGTKAKLFNPNIPRLEVLSHALAYIHANAIKSTAAGGGAQRGVIDADINRVESWFLPLGTRANPAKLKAQVEAVRDLIQSQRKPAERMLEHMGLDKTGAPIAGKRFEHEPGLTGNDILSEPAEEGTP